MIQKKCHKCGNIAKITKTPNKVHYARLDCENCGFLGWLSNPEKKGRNKTSKIKIQDVVKHHNFDKTFCFFCLRDKNKLGKRETFELDHIKELSKGGIDEIENLQILCTACHKLKNWSRLYMNWHINLNEEG